MSEWLQRKQMREARELYRLLTYEVLRERYPSGAKHCTSCRREVPLDGFYLNGRQPPGLKSECIECVLHRRSEHYTKNADTIRDKARARWATIGSWVYEYQREYKKKNKPRLKAAQHGYYLRVRDTPKYIEETRRRSREWHRRYPDAVVANKLGMPVCDAPKALIEAKRLQLQIKRLVREGTT